jgi:hypothetical protein
LFELLAIRELAETTSLENIIPIIEPVQDNYSALNKATELLEEKNQKYIFIYKPNVGKIKTENDILDLKENIFKGENQIPGFIIDNNNDEIISDLINDFDSESIALFHYENKQEVESYFNGMDENKFLNFIHLDRLGPFALRRFRGYTNNFMLRDPFTSERRNADYAEVSEQSLSDDHLYYSEEGYLGYSDFLTIGEEYSESGFAPYAVAIHLTYLLNDMSCWIKHFVSTSNSDQSNIAGKYMEAMNALVDWVEEQDELDKTESLIELIKLHSDEHYPGLGFLKKLQIKHHVQLINRYFERS